MSHKPNYIHALDVWEELGSLFEEDESGENPEIYLVNFIPDQFRATISYLLQSSRTVISQFVLPETEIAVQVTSLQSAVNALSNGSVAASMWIEFYAFPPLTVYVDQPNAMFLSYTRREWTPFSVLGLFDLLSQIAHIAPTSQIYPDTYCYTEYEQEKFLRIWNQYIHVPT